MPKKILYTIHRADSFEWLQKRKANSVHAVVTDPPYAIIEYLPDQLHKKETKNGGIWRLPCNYDGFERNPMPRFTVLNPRDHERILLFHTRLATLLDRVLVPGAHVVIASQTILSHLVTAAFTFCGFELRGQVARIVKTLRGGDRPKGAHEIYQDISVSPRACWEPWLIFRKSCEGRVKDNLEKWQAGALRRPVVEKPFSDVIISCPARGAERKVAPHPSLKPQSFIRKIVWAALPLGKGIILDPFMGSGSTIAAAEFCGYKSIGIEINRKYFNMAKKAIPSLKEIKENGLTKYL